MTRVSFLHTGHHLSKKSIMKTSGNRSYLFEVAAAFTLIFQSLCPLCLVTCECSDGAAAVQLSVDPV